MTSDSKAAASPVNPVSLRIFPISRSPWSSRPVRAWSGSGLPRTRSPDWRSSSGLGGVRGVGRRSGDPLARAQLLEEGAQREHAHRSDAQGLAAEVDAEGPPEPSLGLERRERGAVLAPPAPGRLELDPDG